MNLLEIILFLIVVLLIIRGLHEGILRMAFSLLSCLLVIIVISKVSPMVNDYLKSKNNVQQDMHRIADKYVSSREKSAKEGSSGKGKDYLVNESASEIPRFMREVLVKELEKIDYNAFSEEEIQKMTHDALVVTVEDLLMKGLAFLLTLAFASLVMGVVRILLGILGHLPIIHGVSKLLGGFMGLIEGIILIWIILFVIQCFSATESGNALLQMSRDSQILTEINDFNPLFDIF